MEIDPKFTKLKVWRSGRCAGQRSPAWSETQTNVLTVEKEITINGKAPLRFGIQHYSAVYRNDIVVIETPVHVHDCSSLILNSHVNTFHAKILFHLYKETKFKDFEGEF